MQKFLVGIREDPKDDWKPQKQTDTKLLSTDRRETSVALPQYILLYGSADI